MTAVISFTKVRKPYGWLSNMSHHPLRANDMRTWRTAEAMFQAQRFSDASGVRELIWREPSPMGAKMIAKRYASQMEIAPRSILDIKNMREILCAKIDQHPDLRVKLLETGDAILIEDVSARPSESGLFWGMKRDPEVRTVMPLGWSGANMLGRLWMEIRAGLT